MREARLVTLGLYFKCLQLGLAQLLFLGLLPGLERLDLDEQLAYLLFLCLGQRVLVEGVIERALGISTCYST